MNVVGSVLREQAKITTLEKVNISLLKKLMIKQNSKQHRY